MTQILSNHPFRWNLGARPPLQARPSQHENHEEKEKLFKILEAEKIGMKLTENYSMIPAASVSGLYFANKNAKYFTITS